LALFNKNWRFYICIYIALLFLIKQLIMPPKGLPRDDGKAAAFKLAKIYVKQNVFDMVKRQAKSAAGITRSGLSAVADLFTNKGVPRAPVVKKIMDGKEMNELVERMVEKEKDTGESVSSQLKKIIAKPTRENNIISAMGENNPYNKATSDALVEDLEPVEPDVRRVPETGAEQKARENREADIAEAKGPEGVTREVREAKEAQLIDEQKEAAFRATNPVLVLPSQTILMDGERQRMLTEAKRVGLDSIPITVPGFGTVSRPLSDFKDMGLANIMVKTSGLSKIPIVKEVSDRIDNIVANAAESALNKQFALEYEDVQREQATAILSKKNREFVERKGELPSELTGDRSLTDWLRNNQQKATFDEVVAKASASVSRESKHQATSDFTNLEAFDSDLGVFSEEEWAEEMERQNMLEVATEARRRVGSTVGNILTTGAIAGIAAGIATGDLLQAGTAATLGIIGAGIAADKTRNKFIPPLVGLAAAAAGVVGQEKVVEPIIEATTGVRRTKAALPTQINKQQSSKKAPQWRPKMIAPTSEILEPTKLQAINDEMMFTAFDYVPEGGEGGNGNEKTNVLMAQQEIENELRFLGWRQQLLRRELMYRKQVYNPRTLPLMEFDNMDPSQYEALGIDPAQPLGYQSPYKLFTDVDGLNTQIKRSELFGRVP
jgi:hypothetical protein